jgi:hypothetical protein
MRPSPAALPARCEECGWDTGEHSCECSAWPLWNAESLLAAAEEYFDAFADQVQAGMSYVLALLEAEHVSEVRPVAEGVLLAAMEVRERRAL